MKNLFKLLAIIAVVASIGLSMTSCATLSTYGGTGDQHGMISSLWVTNEVIKDAEKIADFMVIMGLFDVKFEDYAKQVRAAELAGKKVVSVTKWYYVLTITTAYVIK
jgi:hypothetical protein